MIGLLVAVARAGEPELECERGRVAYEREEYQAARDRAISALGEAPGLGIGHQLYVDATTAAGLGSRGLFELVSVEVGTPPWLERVSDLEVAVDQEDWKTIRADVEELVLTWPEAPEQLAPLWDTGWSKVVKLRERMLQALVSPASLAAADIEKLYRIRRLALEAGSPESVAVVDQALVSRGEEQPPPRPRLTRLERADLALSVSKDPIPALPWGTPRSSST